MVYTPIDFWLAAFRTGERLGATLKASQTVIDSRVRTMADAASEPGRGDYAELARMVPEKVEAFSQASTSLFEDAIAIQAQTAANVGALMAMAWRPGNVAGWMAIADRSSRIARRAGQASGKALAPVHKAATGNARRLKRKG